MPNITPIEHTNQMNELYNNDIIHCINNSIIYSTEFECKEDSNNQNTEINISIINTDSVSAIMEYSSGKTAVLNFASYKNPGGRYINGSMAQEESLCASSFLYNILVEMKDYYAWNNKHKNRALYLNRAIYTPDVKFIQNEKVIDCDVITCAAPNRKAALRYDMADEEANFSALRERVIFVLDIAKENKVDTLILGAYGCGVFGQSAMVVAHMFKAFLKDYNCFKNVIFAIPNKRGKYTDEINFNAFKITFSN